MIKIGCKYLSFKGAEISVEDFIQTCHDLRLDSLDFHRRAFASDDTDYLLGIKRQCLDLGLPVGYLGVAGGFAGDDDFQHSKIEEAKSAVDMAMVLGAPLIRVFGWHTYETEGRDPMFAALARCLREVCDYGARKGVVVALQNHNNQQPRLHGARRSAHHPRCRPRQSLFRLVGRICGEKEGGCAAGYGGGRG